MLMKDVVIYYGIGHIMSNTTPYNKAPKAPYVTKAWCNSKFLYG
jgi:hypothetical protein